MAGIRGTDNAACLLPVIAMPGNVHGLF